MLLESDEEILLKLTAAANGGTLSLMETVSLLRPGQESTELVCLAWPSLYSIALASDESFSLKVSK